MALSESTTDLYSSNGRRTQCRFPCPKCRHPVTRVLLTGNTEGVAARRRECQECKHKFYTAQEPEYLIPEDRIYWFDGRPRIIFDDEE